jgi:flagellar biosynthetic protein FliO
MPTLSQSLAVFLVLALLAGLLWLARQKGLAALSGRFAGSGARRTSRQMRVLERLPLTGQHSLHLVECAGRLMVVAVSPGGCSTLANFGEQPSDAISAASGGQ